MPPLPRWSAVCATLLTLASVLALYSGTRLQSAAAAGTQPSVGVMRICSSCGSYGLNRAWGYRYVVLPAWSSGQIPQLKAANPGLKVIEYKNMAATYSYACTNGVDGALPGGVGYCDANENHPDWFLTDTAGARIEFCDYHGLWQMDVGNQSYQDAWAANVAHDAKARGFDGVEIDDTNWSEQYHLCGRTIAKYPNDSDYAAATRSFLARVAPALRAQGLSVFPNIWIPYSSTDTATWKDWISFASGAIQEHFSKWGTGTTQQFGGNEWTWRQSFLPLTEGAHKIFLGITYAPMTDVRSMVYARASFLLDWDGGPSALIFEPTNPEQQDPYSAAWTQDIGTPLGGRYQVGAAWRRDYSAGTVIVNPSTAATQSVALGAQYLAADGSTMTSVSVPPTAAVILRTAGSPPRAPAPAPQPAAPVSRVAPSISGQTKVGGMLTASPGSWSASPISFSYAWSRCDAHGASCSSIAGASAKTYELTSGDGGHTLRVVVTATNAAGTATALSVPTSPVKGATRAFAMNVAAPATPVVAWGAIRVRRRNLAWFGFRIGVRGKATAIRYVDPRSGMNFRATEIDRLLQTGHTLTVQGRGLTRRDRSYPFKLVLHDGSSARRDRFAIVLGNGYVAGGRLAAGAVVIR
jgi:hypothetical protein